MLLFRLEKLEFVEYESVGLAPQRYVDEALLASSVWAAFLQSHVMLRYFWIGAADTAAEPIAFSDST
ncbi:hypothetical protein AL062_23890 [Pseudomonas syringae pv. syringae]|nr:hypothetical protein AL062_23890 [Pseudomonas syringae pv. syringae]